MNVEELENYFKSKKLPNKININKYSEIINVQKFVNSHLQFLKGNSGKKTFIPYYTRLIELKDKIDKL